MDTCFQPSPHKNDIYMIMDMDNDSGYDSRNIDTDSIFDSSTNSTIEILKSFIPKTSSIIPLSEDALLEKPTRKDAHAENTEYQNVSVSSVRSFDEVISSSVMSETSDFNLSQIARSCTPSSVSSEIITIKSRIEVDLSDIDMHNSSKNEDSSPFKGFGKDDFNENICRTEYKSPEKNNFLRKNNSIVETNKIVNNKSVLSNVTNTFEINKKALNLQNIPNCSNKENKCLVPPKTPVKKLIAQADECMSPDLFENAGSLLKTSPREQVLQENFVTKEDQKLLKKIQQGLSGVPPPPNIYSRLSVDEILDKLKVNKSFFWFNNDEGEENSSVRVNTLLIKGDAEVVNEKFPQILSSRHHGLHHNRSKVSEELEHLCEKYGRRYISAETQSTCTVFDIKTGSGTPSKLKASKLFTKSPGRRLSHLARRRITFSSANLQNNKSVVINYNKSAKSTATSKPQYKSSSPLKSSGSAKKNLDHRFRLLSGSSDHGASTSGATIAKKALFQSPVKSFNEENISNNKRKRSIHETNGPNKMFKPSTSMISLKEAEINNRLSLTNNMIGSQPWSNTQTEMTEAFKKKLQWAVYEALKQHEVTPAHAQFKQFATLLARLTRRLVFSSAQGQDAKIERLLKIARHFAFPVVRGKSLEEIEKEYGKNRSKGQKPQGYVAPEHKDAGSFLKSNKENSKSGSKDLSFIAKRNKPPHIENRIDRIRKVINFEGGR